MESITEAMIKRTMDKIQFVRIAAISSLEKIQTQSEDDAVTAEYIRLLRADPSKYETLFLFIHSLIIQRSKMCCLKIHEDP